MNEVSVICPVCDADGRRCNFCQSQGEVSEKKYHYGWEDGGRLNIKKEHKLNKKGET